ncbi:putative glutamate--cysteine ligase [Medicago truncatula]|uniref:glutamate--cysteine ligase n=1 Tax=Medicago truncatula TaxID=3880 RepID=A0A396HNX9_MEDTR|nr:putative glutamate--cysteine ligase [Medicago truncatula]
MGIGFLGLGFLPKWRQEDIPLVPKVRYDILRNYFNKFGSNGINTLLMTCSIQVNLDFSSEADMINKMRASLALQPLSTALFANSPFKQGVPNGYVSLRSHLLGQDDICRNGMLPFAFHDTFGYVYIYFSNIIIFVSKRVSF